MLDVKTLIVGMNPSSREKKTKGSALSRLDEWVREIGLRSFTFTNAVLTPGKVSKRMVDEQRLRTLCSSHDRIIALGSFSSEVLTSLSIDHFKLPHPSGLNRMINDRDLISRYLERCREYVSK